MKKYSNVARYGLVFCLLLAVASSASAKKKVQAKPCWPDGSVMDVWFSDTAKVDVSTLGRQYVITDYNVKNDSSLVQTKAIQRVIDLVAEQGGGVVVVPEGTFLSGALFFKQGTHLLLQQGARLKGSDRIVDFPPCQTRIEGETCSYFPALVNADGLDGFVISGPGTIDGNGFNYWQEFWIRRQWNPQCTNKDAQRPRLVYISNSRNVTVQGVCTINSPFWTNHLYRCEHVRYLDCYIYAPTGGVFDHAGREHGAPSSDAIDLDVCSDVLIRGCYMNVCDDAVVLKGGKGTYADMAPENGPCERILIENCHYGRVHGCLTLGSESLHDCNIILRHCHADDANRVLWLKMRPDTPQHYEYVSVQDVTGRTGSFLVVRPWTQFFKPLDRKDMPKSVCNNINMAKIQMTCRNFFDVGTSDKYDMHDFSFSDIVVDDEREAFNPDLIENTIVNNVIINGKKQ